MGSSPPPLAYRLVLGQSLRTYRERVGLDANTVADKLGWYSRKVNLVETGQRKLVATEVDRLLELYELSEAEQQYVQGLAREARKRDTATPPIAEWAQTYVAVEVAAQELKVFHEELLPGFVQTREYARALLSQGILQPERGVEDAVERRMTRQEHLIGLDAPRVTLILGEAAVRREVGGRRVLLEQLRFLKTFAELPHVSLRVLPFSSGAHTALGNSFSLLYVGDPVVTFAYAETFIDGQWYDRQQHTEKYAIAFDQAHRTSIAERETLTFLDRLIEEGGGE
ncbi:MULTISPECIES: helix-turn-helix domain-containing protein [Saccharopolyspora]|uniref:XRE family transcriptional regulator n=1 Tax=Saccharopolyspora elongata TaxID=2530387 RepID=A0A4R4Y9H5_9PSEU|nr:helix-turn-helix transcriptional regulator [Saccharopolyspora elongata]TDD41178.1 XRE family transcriptional regulator [Saccharopolyspora elongata]